MPDPIPNSRAALREVHRFARHSIYVGEGRNGWMWAGAQRSTLVLGPPRSGKTSSLVIPNILLSDGPVVSTSTKPDVMQSTAVSAQLRRMGVSLRPERRRGLPARRRTRRVVAADDRGVMGRRGRDSGRDGGCQPPERPAGRRAPLDRACGGASLHPPPRRSAGASVHAGRPALDRPARWGSTTRNSVLGDPTGVPSHGSACGDRGDGPPGTIRDLVDHVWRAGCLPD